MSRRQRCRSRACIRSRRRPNRSRRNRRSRRRARRLCCRRRLPVLRRSAGNGGLGQDAQGEFDTAVTQVTVVLFTYESSSICRAKNTKQY